MSDMRDEIVNILSNYYGTDLEWTNGAVAGKVMVLVTEELTTPLRQEIVRLRDELTDLRRELAEVRKQRDDALRLLTDKRTGSLYGGALAGWDGSPTMTGGGPAPDRVAEHLAYARRALGDPETVIGVHELRTATASVIAAVEALAGGASQ